MWPVRSHLYWRFIASSAFVENSSLATSWFDTETIGLGTVFKGNWFDDSLKVVLYALAGSAHFSPVTNNAMGTLLGCCLPKPMKKAEVPCQNVQCCLWERRF